MDVLLDYHNIGYLKPKYIFILTLLLLYVDSDIDSCLRPYETDIMQFFYTPDDNFEEKEEEENDDDFDYNLSTQEKINTHILQKRLYKLFFLLPFSIGPEDEDNSDFQSYKQHSNIYKFIKNDFQIDYEEHKKSFIKFNVNHYLLQEMLPSEKDTSSLLQSNHIPSTSLIQDIHSKNFQDSQDTLFEELDSCETQYQMIMIMLAMVE
ncbi:hypothetical protein ACO0SA_000017 [Hanseniaspora valbyensis]